MRRAIPSFFLAFAVVAVLASDGGAEPAVVSSEALAEAKAHFQRGQELFRERKYEAAADEYWTAYEISGKPELLFNCAQALRLLEVPEPAVALYREFLARAPDHGLAELARTHLAALEAAEAEVEVDAADPPAAAPPAVVSRVNLSLSRSSQRPPPTFAIGATLRAAVDVGRSAGSGAVGGTLDIGSHLRFTVAAILGQSRGGYAGLALRLGSWRLRPHIAAGVPLFFADGAHAGVRGAAGLSWSVVGPFDLVLEMGAEHFFSAPDGYDRTLLVPVLALEVTP